MTRLILLFSLMTFFIFSSFAPSEATAQSGQNYTYEGLLAMGHAKYVSKDYVGALAEYQKAKSNDPGRADAYYFIGCAMKAEKRYQEAASMLSSAVTVAGVDNPVMHAKALYLMAIIWESTKETAKAKYAWSDYKAYAKLHPEIDSFTEIADAHIIAMERWEAEQQKYQIVRDRIAANANTK